MPLVVLGVSTLRKILIIATGMLACAWFQIPTAKRNTSATRSLAADTSELAAI
jgi:hypothetical protein